MRYLIVFTIAVAACAPSSALAGAAALSSAAPSAVATPVASSPSPAATPPPHAYREITALGDFMRLSPDGQTVVSSVQGPKGTTPYYVFQRLDGTVIGRIDNTTAMNSPRWLPDSSAVFISLAAGQRAGPLGLLRTDGTLTDTGLDDASPLLSPDGKWIAAERQEGCCASIRIHEIRIAPRGGGAVRTLITSSDPALQPISFLGWSADGNVIYRDGGRIRIATVEGHISDVAMPATVRGRVATRSAVSPDGRVILACAADPLAFWVATGATMLDLPAQPAWPLRVPWCSDPDEVIWIGGHGLPTRDSAGQLSVFDAIAGTPHGLSLPAGATLVSASGDALLVNLDGDLHLLVNGADRAVGLRFGDSVVRAIAGGRFFLVSGRSGYLIG